MHYRADLFAGINLLLCIIIFILGCWGYAKTKKKTPFYIGSAFGLFAVSHLSTVMGVERTQVLANILIRIFGYAIVALSLYHMNSEK
jgi:Ca2+/Na+ antiporter